MAQNQKTKFNKALKIFVDRYKKDPNVLAVIVFGSYIHLKFDKNSDLDVCVILEKAKIRERGNTWVNGVEIEYFINPVNQIRRYFAIDAKNKTSRTVHMYANSIVIYKKGNLINQLIKEAKTIIGEKPPAINNKEIELAKYSLDDIQKDLNDVYFKKDIFAFYLIANEILTECLRVFYRFKRIKKEKPKEMQEHLRNLDGKFEILFCKAVTIQDIDKKYRAINVLVNYVENLIGGKRAKEWKLRSKCTV